MAESHNPKDQMFLACLHKEYKKNKGGFNALNDLLKGISGFLTGIDHVSDTGHGPAINIDFYNILSNGERHIRALLTNIENSDKLVKTKKAVPEKLIKGIDDLLDESLNKNEFKASLTKLFKDYDIKETSIEKEDEELPF